ncbi:MAG: N-formylglutamate amidohydrolase [Saprospiraceae bacterium]|nr:N-formylglutamate amidohydrolase [Saprospiraceae bacterium]
MNKLILHVPHASREIPIMDGFLISKAQIEDEILKLTDWHTEDLYDSVDCDRIVFEYSRVFCDPERFSDDADEPMAKLGMGVLYEKTDALEPMRNITPELRKRILEEYYFKHHARLNAAVKNQLELAGQALILDCHSFPDSPLNRTLHKVLPRPDFNIGTDSFHTSQRLIDISVAFFEERNLSLGIDYPFNGSIVPMEYYQKNSKVQSIMLEVNRRLYLKEGSQEKSDNYEDTKAHVQAYIALLQKEI